jgi:quercetin dioxygenase-like cupin family protein
MTEEQFKALAKEKGFGDVISKEYGPNFEEPMHTHEVTVMAMVTEGELTLVLEDGSTTYGSGGWCELEADTLHTERTGSSGATVLLAQKSP